MSMIDLKGSRPSALVNLARLQHESVLTLVKTETPDPSGQPISSSNDNYPSETSIG